jgi:type I restriction enzyme S subunit
MKFTKPRLDTLCDIQIGKTPRRSVSKYWGNGHPWVSISDIKSKIVSETKEEITDEAIKETGCKKIAKDTLLMSFKLSIGKLAFAGSDLYTNEAIVALPVKDNKKVHAEYLYYVLKSIPLIGSNVAAKGATLNKASISSLNIPIPETIDDQIRIAEVLSKVERLISQRKESIILIDELLKSTFLEMFGDPKINPFKYPIRHLSEFYFTPKQGVKCGPFGSALKKDEYTKDGIPVWIMDNISKDGKFSPDGCLWVSEEKYKDLTSYNSQNGDILISRAGTVGKMCVLESEFKQSIISTNLIRLRLSRDLSPQYFVCLMNYCKGRVGRLKTGPDGAFTHMSTKVLDGLFFPNPSIEKQLEFIKIYNKTQSIFIDLKESQGELENLASSLSHQAFKGELDLSKLEINHIIPVSQGGTDDEENIQVVSSKENRKISDKPKTSRVGNGIMENFYEEDIAVLLKEHFGSFDFRFSEVIEFFENEKAVALNYLTSEELKRNRNQLEQDIKTFIFSCVEGKNPHLKLKQWFFNAFDDIELLGLNPRNGRDDLLDELNESYGSLELEDITGIYFQIEK